MKHAYLIMAHNQWDVLEQLLYVLDDSRNDIYLHIDKKASPPKNLSTLITHSNLYFVKQHNIVWGGTQMMQCTISMLEYAAKQIYTHYHFISGTDFPIKSQDYIHNFFDNHPQQQFIGVDWAGIESGKFLDRMQYFHFLINIIGKRERTSVLYRVLGRIEDCMLTLQHKAGINRISYNMYKGSSWFSISSDLVAIIITHKNEILKRYRFGANTDEIWLQTFAMEHIPEQIASSNLRYIKWIQGNPSPEIITMADYNELLQSDMLFTRKVDWNKDKDVILKLKSHILGEQL